MKATILNLCLAVLVTGAVFLPSDSRADNIIRQTRIKTAQQYDMVVTSDASTANSIATVYGGGSVFDLYAYGSAWDTNLYFLDRKVIGFYQPTASISIQTGDQSNEWFSSGLPPRTRADKPYTLAISVSGLTTDPTAPRAAREVLYSHVGQNFNTTYTPGTNAEYSLSSYYMGNQSPNYTPIYTRLTPMAPTKAMGIEKFTISSLADETAPASILASKMLIVWPVTEAIINGITDGMTIRDGLPKIETHYKDLYPLSYTYIHIYQGAPQLGKTGTVFGGSIRWHNTSVPQNELVSLEAWESMIPTDGQYTIEVITTTPFNNWAPERLAFKTFNVNRLVRVNGQVITSEK